jgi:hypothetical protein
MWQRNKALKMRHKTNMPKTHKRQICCKEKEVEEGSAQEEAIKFSFSNINLIQ